MDRVSMDEQAYRHLVDETFRKLDEGFADVDPDLAESTLSQGALTIVFPGGVKCIVSPQPPVRQVWVAYTDRAWHLNYDPAKGRWYDDRGEGLELFALIRDIARKAAGVDVPIP
jgi:CyaY protein